MNRKVLIGAVVVVVLLAGAGVGAYAINFFTPRTTSSSSDSSAPLSTPSSSPSVGGTLAGKWAVTSGSSAGYRANEKFLEQSSPSQAVADSTGVSGGVTIVDNGGALTAQQLSVVVDMSKLKSSDQFAIHGSNQRDRFVNPNYLETGQFPTATYAVDSISIPAAAAAGGQQQLSTSGKLTIHGMTKDVSIPMTGQVNGDKLEVQGSVAINMTDYGVRLPSVPFTSVQPGVTIAFHVLFARA
ncbi:MAG TPA: YceI family protein [Candidatus Dormibacteraeota bacterium]|nr:YceI family protein [Candidatus Dormibacteraeota bacterium]